MYFNLATNTLDRREEEWGNLDTLFKCQRHGLVCARLRE